MERKSGKQGVEELTQLQKEELEYRQEGGAHPPRGRHDHSRYHEVPKQTVVWNAGLPEFPVHRRGPPVRGY